MDLELEDANIFLADFRRQQHLPSAVAVEKANAILILVYMTFYFSLKALRIFLKIL